MEHGNVKALLSSEDAGWGWKGGRWPTQQLKKLYLPSNLQAKAKSALKGSYILNERKQFKFCHAVCTHESPISGAAARNLRLVR